MELFLFVFLSLFGSCGENFRKGKDFKTQSIWWFDWNNLIWMGCGWMTTEQNPAFQGGCSSHGGDCCCECDVGVWSLASLISETGCGARRSTRDTERQRCLAQGPFTSSSNTFTVQYRHLYNLSLPDTALFVTHCLKPSDVQKEENYVMRFYGTISRNN